MTMRTRPKRRRRTAIMPLCPCHGEPMYADAYQFYCRVKRQETWRTASARYRLTPRGAAKDAEGRHRRIFAGQHCVGHARTVRLAKRLTKFAHRAMQQFVRCQRAEAAAMSSLLSGDRTCRSVEILARNKS